MAPITTSYDTVSGDETTLAVNITATQTSGIKLASMNINGAATAVAATSGVLEIEQQIDGTRRVEWMAFNGVTVNSDNTVTLDSAGVSRDVSRTGSSLTGSGTGQRFNKGAIVRLVTFHYLLNQKADIDRTNTWTAAQTFGTAGEVLFSGTDVVGLKVKTLTTAERDAIASPGVGGGIIYNSTTGVVNFREGNAWVPNGSSGSVADASTTVAGKVEEATTAEIGAGTAAGGTSARLFINPSSTVKTSSGAGDENKLGVLGSSGTFAPGFLGTGTPSSSNFLRGDGAWTVVGGLPGFYGDGSDGNVTISSNSTITRDMFYNNLTVDDTFFLNTSGYRVFVLGTLTLSGTGNRIGRNGNAGTVGGNRSGTTGGSGGAGGAALAAGSLPGGLGGGAGGNGKNSGAGNGDNGTNGSAAAYGIGTTGGAGGNGGSTGSVGGTGGTGGVVTAAATIRSASKAFAWADWLSGTYTVINGNGSGGGGGGGASGANASGGGGGAGGNAGCVFIAARTITGTGGISANGGDGGRGGDGNASDAGQGGGGAGGGGGVVVLCYQTKTGWSGTISTTGGTGGLAGAVGSGAGTAGASGPAGASYQFQI